jgi:hypothetical protein
MSTPRRKAYAAEGGALSYEGWEVLIGLCVGVTILWRIFLDQYGLGSLFGLLMLAFIVWGAWWWDRPDHKYITQTPPPKDYKSPLDDFHVPTLGELKKKVEAEKTRVSTDVEPQHRSQSTSVVSRKSPGRKKCSKCGYFHSPQELCGFLPGR